MFRNTKMTVADAKRLGLLSPGKMPSKYGNKKTFYKGDWFDSKKEAARAMELDLLFKAKQITDWYPQPKFEIKHNGVKICSYIADFAVAYPDGHTEYEDVKGFKTPVYNLKKKLVKAFYDITIKEL